MSNPQITHPKLGQIRGVRAVDGVDQYLGLQYGTLKDRFARSELCMPQQTSSEVINATKYGPTVLVPPNAWQAEEALIQNSLPTSKPAEQSDTEGLSLNITIPSASAGTRLPVVFYVHGGGFSTGSSVFAGANMANLTKTSVDMGCPMISVTINYRVGSAGFLTSPEMEAAGYKPNNGLKDQRLALRWIQEYIEGFGGDPKRVTFFGESAGAASGFFHLHSPKPMFSQLISMSGTSMLHPRPLPLVHKAFGSIAEILGAKDKSPEDKVQVLLNTPSGEFTAKLGRVPMVGPVVDGDFIPKLSSFTDYEDPEKFVALFPGVRECKRLLIGDCDMDAMVWGMRIAGRPDPFPKTLQHYLSMVFDPIDPSITPTLVKAYGLDVTVTSNSRETTLPVLNLGNDITYAEPTRRAVRAWSKIGMPDSEPFYYTFNCPNPWDGLWKGFAGHVMDLTFLLQNYNEYLAPGQKKVAERMARDFITFIQGDEPWEASRGGENLGAMVYFADAEGDEDKSMFVPDGAPEKTGRRKVLQELLTAGHLDKLLDAWNMFMRGPPQ
ncbi:Alpha/Beta hydrolase protein [Leptodontidium sp. MPI-SDFR-AT-0119]|nr:Alpha/Beta hydrolase protein [Leptodontidium sp. MPI-SDFR-AT-0119]